MKGAKNALTNGKSLSSQLELKKLIGKFDKGDHIKILDQNNNRMCKRIKLLFLQIEISKIKGSS